MWRGRLLAKTDRATRGCSSYTRTNRATVCHEEQRKVPPQGASRSILEKMQREKKENKGPMTQEKAQVDRFCLTKRSRIFQIGAKWLGENAKGLGAQVPTRVSWHQRESQRTRKGRNTARCRTDTYIKNVWRTVLVTNTCGI